MEPRRETEILVHIAAPARTRDDANYRRLAAAYLDFEPRERRQLCSLGDDRPRPEEPGATLNLPASQIQGLLEIPGWDGSRGVVSSPNLSFASVIDNLKSPEVHWAKNDGPGTGRDQQALQLSWHTPPSVVEDSCPDNAIAQPGLSSPTRILEFYLSGFDSSQSEQSEVLPTAKKYKTALASLTVPGSSDSTPPEGSVAREFAQRPSTSPTPVIIPQSPNLGLQTTGLAPSSNKGTSVEEVVSSCSAPDSKQVIRVTSSGEHSTSRARHKRPWPGATLSIPVISSGDYNSVSSRAESEPPRSGKRTRGINDLEVTTSLARSTSDVGPRPTGSSRDPRTPCSSRNAKRLRVDGPSPAVGIGALRDDSILTPKLAQLARRLGIDGRFHPLRQTRELRPHERGYWRVDCAVWTTEQRMGAWEFLANYIGIGDAGWGVSCIRDDEFTWLRVYCWGRIIRHIYFLIYLASRRELLNTPDVTWMDGGGSAVVVMKAKTREANSG